MTENKTNKTDLLKPPTRPLVTPLVNQDQLNASQTKVTLQKQVPIAKKIVVKDGIQPPSEIQISKGHIYTPSNTTTSTPKPKPIKKSKTKKGSYKKGSYKKGGKQNAKFKKKKKALGYERPMIGNGHHKALCEVYGMLLPRDNPPNDNQLYFLILSDGTEIPLLARQPKLRVALQRGRAFGTHFFVCYPRLVDGVITSLDLKSWSDKPIWDKDHNNKETWYFQGLWTKKKELVVQRDIEMVQVKKWWHQTGKISNYHYQFDNGDYHTKKGKLKDGNLYCLFADRKGTKLRIKNIEELNVDNPKERQNLIPDCISKATNKTVNDK